MWCRRRSTHTSRATSRQCSTGLRPTSSSRSPDQPDVRDYRGHEGLLQVMAEWIGIWDDWSVEILHIREIGDRVLVDARQRGRGKGSGAPGEGEVAFVFTVRHGKIARWQMFHSEQQALEAVGLRE